ncbi:EAL domain-containing protein [Catenovulum maritimum]|uniref:EAL domain-containing protein n=1 Tax=Catenovulum maritimum TaxID=1513271 RepID=UPI00065FD731|nr:EAL domain-containing protein [Catenovulum maritimum]
MASLPLKTSARTLFAWQRRFTIAIGFLMLSCVSVWCLTISHLTEQQINQYIINQIKLKPEISLEELEQALVSNPTLTWFVELDTQKRIPLNPESWLDWSQQSENFTIEGNKSFYLRYIVVDGAHIIFITVSLFCFWLIVLSVFWSLSRTTEKQLFSLERKARRLNLSARARNKSQHEDLFTVINQLLDELSWSRQEQNKVDKFIRVQTFLDPETGIGNRVFFENRLEALLNIEEQIEQGAVIGIRFNHYDELQEKFGEDLAIEVLNQYSNIINQSLRRHPQAIFARYSSQDLAIILPNIAIREIEQLCNHLLRALEHVRLPKEVDKDSFYHIGVATFKSGDNLTQILLEADMAIRAAQLQGSCNWFMYQDEDNVKTVTMGSLQWRTLLESTLSNQSFALYFQAVINIQPRQLNHQEVLVRLRNRDGKVLNASLFMPMAQKCGLVTPIDRYVLNRLFELFDQDINSPVRCSVNVHVESLLNLEFKQWLINHLTIHAHHAERLIIEISEHAIVTHSEELENILFQLDRLNVRLLIDQVGQYVLNSSYLKQHPVSYLKLHSSIVRNINLRSENQLFIRSLQGTCAGSNIKIFAFGLETEAEWQVIKQLHLAGAQGHYFNQPEANLLTK